MELTSLTSTYTLANGNKIPCVGFGTWQSADGDEAYTAVLTALKNGYRHIDTATAYENEESVGRAINDFRSQSGVKREELFITTKLWNKDHGYEATREIRGLPDPKKSSIPIVAMTANAFEEDRKNALAAGMDGHLAKPIDDQKLVQTLMEFRMSRPG